MDWTSTILSRDDFSEKKTRLKFKILQRYKYENIVYTRFKKKFCEGIVLRHCYHPSPRC